MRRQHGPELQALQAFGGFFDPDLAGQRGERGRDRIGRRGRPTSVVGGRFALPQHPHPVELLGQVDQVEVARERASHLFGPHRLEVGHQRLGLLDGREPTVTVRGDRQFTQPFHVGEQFVPAILREHLPEQLAQQPHVRAERIGHLVTRPTPAVAVGTGTRRGA